MMSLHYEHKISYTFFACLGVNTPAYWLPGNAKTNKTAHPKQRLVTRKNETPTQTP